MSTVSKGYTFGSTELVTNTKLHNLVDDATVTSVAEADMDITSSPTTDYVMIYNGTKLDWLSQQSLASINAGASSSSTAIENGSLVSYLCSINHGLSNQFANVTVWDNDNKKVIPSEITALDADNVLLDFTGYGSLVSIWNVGII